MLTNQIAFLEEGEPFQAPLPCFSQHRYKEERNSTASYNCSQRKPLRSREELWSQNPCQRFGNTVSHSSCSSFYCQQEKIASQETNFEILTKHESMSPAPWLCIAVDLSGSGDTTEGWQRFACLGRIICVYLHRYL